jgi:hypothetical protein
MQPHSRQFGEHVDISLDEKKARWTTVDSLTLVEAGKEDFSSPLVWAGVGPASLESELVNTVANAPTILVTLAGFSGFEVGLRRSVVYDSSPKFKKPSTPTLGLSIDPLETP